jgi:hypothetical protein
VTLLDAVTDTVGVVRRDYGLVMNSLGIEKPGEWFGDGKDGYGVKIVAHLVLMARHRAALLGYEREDLVRLLDATGGGWAEWAGRRSPGLPGAGAFPCNPVAVPRSR